MKPNADIHSRQSERQYRGEDEALPLVKWMNFHGDVDAVNYEAVEESKAQIAEILDWIIELLSLGDREWEKIPKLKVQINERLRECTLVAQVEINFGRPLPPPGSDLAVTLDLQPGPGTKHLANIMPTEIGPGEIGKTFIPFAGHVYLVMLIDLWRAGLIGNLRRCKNCGKFLYKKFPHQEFCPGGQCREAEKRSPAYKAKRNKMLRENYPYVKKLKAKKKLKAGR